MITKEEIKKLLDNISEPEFFTVDVKISQGGKITVFVDNYKGITISQCEAIHRILYPEISKKNENFELEVSSPGITKELKVWQQFAKLKDKEIDITTTEDEHFTGIILYAYQQNVTVAQSSENKLTLSYNDIKKAKLIINF